MCVCCFNRGRPKKINLDYPKSLQFTNEISNSNSNTNINAKEEFLMEQDDDHSLISYNYTNTCIIDDNLSAQFHGFN